jgi:low temperature requirement protein LtrA
MQPLLAAFDSDTLTAFYIFAFAGLIIALGLVGSALMALKKKDRKAVRFYFIIAAVCCSVSLCLIFLALLLGKEVH